MTSSLNPPLVSYLPLNINPTFPTPKQSFFPSLFSSVPLPPLVSLSWWPPHQPPYILSFPRPLLCLSLCHTHMATKSIPSLHHHKHHNYSIRQRHSIDCPPSSLPSSLFPKPSTTNPKPSLTQSFSSIITFSLPFSSSSSSSISTTSSISQTISFDLLRQHLSSKNFRQADEETRRLLIILAGEAAQKRGYVFFSEVQFISEADLKTIDDLWRQHSDNKLGYSVQKRIWNKVSRDFTKFFLKVGWMKKLETEVEQYNYRSFPNEFMWELDDDTPEGHLPLTNALRGTQLLNSILSHPAFQGDDDDEDEGVDEVVEEKGSDNVGGFNSLRGSKSKPLSKGFFKPDYSF